MSTVVMMKATHSTRSLPSIARVMIKGTPRRGDTNSIALKNRTKDEIDATAIALGKIHSVVTSM